MKRMAGDENGVNRRRAQSILLVAGKEVSCIRALMLGSLNSGFADSLAFWFTTTLNRPRIAIPSSTLQGALFGLGAPLQTAILMYPFALLWPINPVTSKFTAETHSCIFPKLPLRSSVDGHFSRVAEGVR